MGQGEEFKTRDEPKVEILERGELFFFYRPKIDKEEAHSVDDVQRLYMVLRPESGERATEEKQSSESGKEGVKKDDGRTSTSTTSSANAESTDERGSEGGHGVQKVNIEKETLLRFIVMGRKSLPDLSERRGRPYWGFVEMVTTNVEDVKSALEGEEYDTATRGHRHQSPARALGEGIYRILRHNSGKKTHTHLIYKLEFPREDEKHEPQEALEFPREDEKHEPQEALNIENEGSFLIQFPREDEKHEPQEALNIENEGSFLIQIKNPDQHGNSQFRGLQNKRRAAFPAHLQGQLGKLGYTLADPPDFLNYEGCEFLLISASDDIEDELGLELKTEEGNAEDKSCSDLVRTFGETALVSPLLKGTCLVRTFGETALVSPLLKGTWV